jgi:hypothetical protein
MYKENISNSNLVFLKKVDWVSEQKLCELDPEKLELVLLDRIETKNNTEYHYLMKSAIAIVFDGLRERNPSYNYFIRYLIFYLIFQLKLHWLF